MTGRTLSVEHRKRISAAKMGSQHSPKTKEKIKQAMTKNMHQTSMHTLIPKTSMSRSDLTAENVKDIRERYSHEPGATIRSLAEEFNVSRHTIHSIVHYRTWK